MKNSNIRINDPNWEGDTSITVPDNDYVLLVPSSGRMENPLSIQFIAKGGDHSWCVSGRDFDEYKKAFPRIEIDPELRWAEIGGGLGGLIPHLAVRCNNKPILVDPADYTKMREILESVLERSTSGDIADKVCERLHVLLDRCNVMTDPSQVHLVNTTLGQASKNPSLLGSVDRVIELIGPGNYPETEAENSTQIRQDILQRIGQMKERLLAVGGTSYVYNG